MHTPVSGWLLLTYIFICIYIYILYRGGHLLSLSGSNLCYAAADCSRNEYACLWEAAADSTQNARAPALIASTSSVTCSTPVWPFAATTTHLSLLDLSASAVVERTRMLTYAGVC